VCLAAAGPAALRVRRERFAGDRDAVKAQTAEAALALLLDVLEGAGHEH